MKDVRKSINDLTETILRISTVYGELDSRDNKLQIAEALSDTLKIQVKLLDLRIESEQEEK